MINAVKKMAVNLSPGYFALVMSTGALSIAANALQFRWIALFLLFFNVLAYLVLSILIIIQAVFYFPKFLNGLLSHQRGPGFFALVAGTCILGSQLVNVIKMNSVAIILWYVGIALWVIIMYTFFLAVITRKDKPELREGINGAWLIAAVATQSVAVLGTLIAPQFSSGRAAVVLFIALGMYLLGCMLYLNIIALIFYRLTFIKLEDAGFTPPYWINMGAVAIATLAGSTLILHSSYWSVLGDLLPFLKGFTLFFWITGTWWIPLLLVLMIWRIFFHHDPFKYSAQYWSMVFPLAMYTIGTYKLLQAVKIPFLQFIPNTFIYAALLVWVLGVILMTYHLFTGSRTLSSND